ncbi:hypothetical protein C8F04DRAFT_1199462 [Mycena alexandri]|uniref:F-box domain-containing protein n=1 Tax=Mycena alexandri TaxID=1745969 RepID=A0AAD6S1C0_9AGAR|nr:hypothetical protein C8F04DRAFT_1199462 [Mycena alexandri]
MDLSSGRVPRTKFLPPRLGVYREAAICIFIGRPYDSHWATILNGLSGESHSGGPKDSLSALPSEILAIITRLLPLDSRQSLAKTSNKLANLCARELQAGVSTLLLRFGLYHSEVRFMQTLTASLLAGDAIPYVLDYRSPVERLVIITPSMSFFKLHSSHDSVVRFFSLATGRTHRTRAGESDRGVEAVTRFGRGEDPDWIRVFRSETDSALDCITYLPFSHLFGAITAYGVWLPYPESATKGCSFPNRGSMAMMLGSAAAEWYVSRVIQKYTGVFHFSFGFAPGHVCGTAYECPATPRFTDDEGCLNLFFPALPFGVVARPSSVYPSATCMTWSLYGGACVESINVRRTKGACEYPVV